MSTYAAKFYEGRYVMGQIAGKMTKTNTIGYIVSFPIPEVISGINAFERGMQTTNPNAKIKIVWVNTWFDPGKEADAAKALLAQGADILTQHTDSAAPLQEAEKVSKLGFGQSSDMMKFAPKAQLTANTDNWGPYYTQRIQALIDGKWKSDDTWDGIGKNMVVMAPFANMPDDVKAMAREDDRRHRLGRHPALRLPGARPGRQGPLQARRKDAGRRRRAGDELVCQRRRRQNPAISPISPRIGRDISRGGLGAASFS